MKNEQLTDSSLQELSCGCFNPIEEYKSRWFD